MNDDVFNSINNQFYQKRIEINFLPSELDKLSDSQRKEIEEKIIRLCVNGYDDCYKYIPFLKHEQIELSLTPEIIDKFSPFTQTKAYYYLLVKTKKIEYLEKLKLVANNSIQIYSWLLHCVTLSELDSNNKKNLLDYLAAVSLSVKDDSNKLCQKIYDRVLSSMSGLDNTEKLESSGYKFLN